MHSSPVVSHQPQAVANAAKILIVEDHQASARMLALTLAREGFVVRTVHDAATAYELAQWTMPDLMLVDFALGGADGLELVHWIKNDPRLRKIPTVLCSSHSLENDPLVRESGCCDFIPKPIDTRDLGRRIQACLDLSRADALTPPHTKARIWSGGPAPEASRRRSTIE